jgi:hypothetical protein
MRNRDGFNSGYTYDPDSFLIMLDYMASRCLTSTLSDFVSTPRPTNVRIRGILGNAKVAATFVGTVKWGFEDDTGQTHFFELPNTYYSSAVPGRILSLQHWAQVANDNKPMTRGTYSATFDDCIEMYWKQRQFKKTVTYNPTTNVATLQSAPSYCSFSTYCAELTDDEPTSNFVTMSNVISDDEDDGDLSLGASTAVSQTREIDIEPKSSNMTTNMVMTTASKNDNATSFSLDGPLETTVIEDEEVNIADVQSELMHWHYRLGHLSCRKLKQMALSHEIPYRGLQNVRPFRCSACMHVFKGNKKPWRTKAPVNERSVPAITAPGDCVSVDQLESKTPCFVAQMKSPVLTKHRYTAATVFVDQFS